MMLFKTFWPFGALLLFSMLPATAAPTSPSKPQSTSFADFDRRAKAGQQLDVVFFGASLTWGANASDPLLASYRAVMARKFEAAYPTARFKFHDGAIGGTGSQLGVFRLNRDVLRHHPDLVFLDFSANDDIYSADEETLASYESLVRRIVTDAKVPLVQVIFPFQWNTKPGELPKMKRRDAHLAISRAYKTSVGDAIELASHRIASGEISSEKLWPIDGAHPGDNGYALFADAAWQGFRRGVEKKLVCTAPPTMLHAPTYMTNNRVRISSLGPLPAGWKVGMANRTSAWFDSLMSRWLDDETIASNRRSEKDAAGKTQVSPQEFAPLRLKFQGSQILLFGESTAASGKYRVLVDGKLVERKNGTAVQTEFDPGATARAAGGNVRYAEVVVQGLDPKIEHSLEIVPVFEADKTQELRIESICVAGGAATVVQDTSSAPQ